MCYDACVFNTKMHKQQVDTGSVDLTWIFTQSVFMALNTILWTLSYPEIRQEHPIEEVVHHISLAMDVITYSAQRWPGVESAVQLYKSLIAGCLRAYESAESFVVHSPATTAGIASDAPSNAASPGTIPSPSNPSFTPGTSPNSPEQPVPKPAFQGAHPPLHGSQPSPKIDYRQQTFLGPTYAPQPTLRPPMSQQTYKISNTHYVGNVTQPTPTMSASAQTPRTTYHAGFQYPQVPGVPQQTPHQVPIQSHLRPKSEPSNTSHPGPLSSMLAADAPIHTTLDPISQSNPTFHGTGLATSSATAPFDPSSQFNPFPSMPSGLQHWNPTYTTAPTTTMNPSTITSNIPLHNPNPDPDAMFWLGSIGDHYSQYFHQPYDVPAWRNRSLTQDEHIELLASLAQSLPGFTRPVGDDARARYGGGMP